MAPSDGIGEAFANELCSRGFNVILHGRNPKKLSTVQSKLTAAFPKAEIRTFVADAAASSTTNSAAIQDLVDSIKDLKLTVLINNVGGAGNLKAAFTTFADHTTKEIDDMISINMLFTLHLTQALLPLMIKQDSALIMNTGSSSYIGLPYITVYSPTKAYLNAWGNALYTELQAEGITNVEVLTVVSGNTQTGQDTRPANFLRPTAKAYVKGALAKVGCGRTIVVGYFSHALQSAVTELLPRWAQRKVLGMALKPYKGKNLDE
ncbi:NAD(P)-binding protein [Mollisia scopiformis]|uniref:NAD(P)-binding protein n=1 Tax=Mollisia scopiformis TaxID=149040 RepID=A0A194X4C1_MOLSC|nr:NAD(P)-binding protein [Mollisia scopiformis]KUJ15028.1 NAD(P)-binding protein [Mollisia scopiformis]